MNRRALYIVVAVQALFAISLIFVGVISREERRVRYLELTHRITAGQATESEFKSLAQLAPANADETTVRAMFGAPLRTAERIRVENSGERTGRFWIYYFATPENRAPGPDEIRQLQGPVRTFVISFDKSGMARGDFLSVIHPLEQPQSEK